MHRNAPMTIDECVALPWRPIIQADPDGGVVLTVEALDDFAVYGATEAEVRSMWTEALRSHLDGYLRVGKAIPVVDMRPLGATGTAVTN